MVNDKNKIIIRERVSDICPDDLTGDLEIISDSLFTAFSFAESRGYFNLSVEITGEYEGRHLALFGDRLETDSEVRKRLRKNQSYEERKKKKDQKEKENIIKRAKKLGLKITE